MLARHRRSIRAALLVASVATLAGTMLAAPAAFAAPSRPAVAPAEVAVPRLADAPVASAVAQVATAAKTVAQVSAGVQVPAEPEAVAQVTTEPESVPAGPCDSDIDFNEVISCNVTSPTQIRDLNFGAAAGDQVRVRVVVTGGAVNPLVSVRLGGSTVCGPTFADEFTCAIPSAGTYTLRVDANSSGTGSFDTTIQRLNNPVGCKDLAYGTTGKIGDLGKAVEMDCFRHDAATGQRWRIRVVETAGAALLYHEVIRPDGTTVCALNSSTDTTCLLDANGQFRILVRDDNGLDTGDYRIVLQKYPGPAGCAAGDFGAARTVKSDNPGTVDCVTFTGSIGDQIRVRVVTTAGAWNPLTDLVAPDGSTLCGPTFADEFTCALTSNGTHTFVVRDGAGTGQSTGEARTFLQRLNDPVGCKSLKPGPDGKTGSIGTAVEMDCWFRAAAAGDRWRIRVVETAGAALLYHEVIRPDGTTVCALNSSTDTTCSLDANGEFRILVRDDNGLETGDYRIVLEKFPGPTGCPTLDYGDPSEVEVALAGGLACIKVDGASGDQIRVRVVTTAGAWNPLTDVVAKDGSTVCGPTFADELTCALTTSGSATIIIRDGAGTGSSTGTADIEVQRLNNPVGCKALPPGPDGKTGSIGTAVEMDCWFRAAAAGDRWRIRVVELAGAALLYHEVIRPDGTTVCALNSSTDTTCSLDANGDFRILVRDDNGLETGDYRIVLEKFPGPTGCPTLDYGDPSEVEVALAGGLACIKVDGASGDQIRVRVVTTAGAWNPLTDVVAKDGSTVCGPTFADELTCALTTSGSATIIIRDGAGTGSSTGTADIEVQRLNNPVGCSNLAYGPNGSTGSITPAVEMDCFRHDASAGQRWRIRVVETAGAALLYHEVIRPDGTTVCALNSSTDTTCLLDANGEFRILVRDDNGLETGDYRIVLEKFPGPTGCDTVVVGGPIETGAVSLAGALACFTFSGTAGDDISFSVALTGGAWNPLTDVVRADGSTLCGPTFADVFTCTLTTNGTHTVIIRDGAGTGSSTGNYALELDEV